MNSLESRKRDFAGYLRIKNTYREKKVLICRKCFAPLKVPTIKVSTLASCLCTYVNK